MERGLHASLFEVMKFDAFFRFELVKTNLILRENGLNAEHYQGMPETVSYDIKLLEKLAKDGRYVANFDRYFRMGQSLNSLEMLQSCVVYTSKNSTLEYFMKILMSFPVYKLSFFPLNAKEMFILKLFQYLS